MKNVLFVATVYKFFNFEKSDMSILKNMGYVIHTASNMAESNWLKDDGSLDELNPVKHQIDFGRTPFSTSSIRAYKQLKELMFENHYDLIHCHTPVAAAIARLAAIKTRRKGTKVIYTDHGFHFHKQSGWKNWVLFYPIEYILSFFTDMIISINKEDFGVIQKFHTPMKRYIPGVGIDVERISNMDFDRKAVRQKFNIPSDAFLLISIGELSVRKNQSVVMEAMSILRNPKIYYILCGTGIMGQKYKELAKELLLENNVIFAGYQSQDDVFKIAHSSDLGVLPSLIEGLGLAGLESMAAGLPVVASGVHGINDYVIDNETGLTCSPSSAHDFAKAINRLYSDHTLYGYCREKARLKALDFDISKVSKLMYEYYKEV